MSDSLRQNVRRPKRQRIRRGVQIVMLMLFPATFFYFSPVVSAMGASEGIVTGSLLLFGLLFASSVVVGRLFCSWVCPGGALGEIVGDARPGRLRRDRVHWIKYLVWVPWLATILLLFIGAGGVSGVEPLYSTEAGFSTTSLSHLIAYLMVVAVFLVLMFAVGKRAPCHTICWMAPFMILGRSVGNALRLPALRLAADADACIHCGKCSAACPMSLEVQRMAERGAMDHTDCILCAECIDVCPKSVIGYRWKTPGRTVPAPSWLRPLRCSDRAR
ncbi:MAG: 4Fe-4S binding protein [Spirochaetota bacterium]